MSELTYILAGFLIDGSGGAIQENMVLTIQDDAIWDVREATEKDSLPNLIDLSGCTIMPCLVDSHVHLFMSGTDNETVRQNQLVDGFDEIKDVISGHISQHMQYGIMTVRDGGDSRAHAVRYKNECLKHHNSFFNMRVAGRAWRKRGRYGKLIGRSPEDGETLAGAILKNSEAIDHIKIVNSGLNSLTEFGKETTYQFNENELSNAVKAASQKGYKVMVHANGKEPVYTAVKAGCTSIEHGFFMGMDNLELMAEKNIFWVPTACTMKAYAEYLKKGSVEAEISKRNLAHQLEQMRLAREKGVPVALGTDAGSLGVHHGASVIEELKLLLKAGFSLPEAVKCASYNGTTLLGLKNTGLLKKRTRADFIAVKGSPVDFPDSLGNIEKMFVKGVELKHGGIN